MAHRVHAFAVLAALALAGAAPAPGRAHEPGSSSAPARSAATPSTRTLASWYGREHHGKLTANGERFDMHALTAAHPTLPFGTRVVVTNLRNGRRVTVRVNDRGPFVRGRGIDLSYAAARALGSLGAGVVPVRVALETPRTGAR